MWGRSGAITSKSTSGTEPLEGGPAREAYATGRHCSRRARGDLLHAEGLGRSRAHAGDCGRRAGVRQCQGVRAPASDGRDRAAPGRVGGAETDAHLHREADRKLRPESRGTALHGDDAERSDRHGQPDRARPRQAARQDPHHRPLRHEALPESDVRGRERRRVERGVPDRDGARSSRRSRRASSPTSWSGSTARKLSSSGTRTRTAPTAAATTSRPRRRRAQSRRSRR